MQNKVTSIFGSIGGLSLLLQQFGYHFVIGGKDLLGIIAATALAGASIAAKDWNTHSNQAQVNSATAGK